MLKEHETMIKIVVDIRRRILAGGSEMHSDCESVLLDDGSERDDLWNANWYPADQEIVFDQYSSKIGKSKHFNSERGASSTGRVRCH